MILICATGGIQREPGSAKTGKRNKLESPMRDRRDELVVDGRVLEGGGTGGELFWAF